MQEPSYQSPMEKYQSNMEWALLALFIGLFASFLVGYVVSPGHLSPWYKRMDPLKNDVWNPKPADTCFFPEGAEANYYAPAEERYFILRGDDITQVEPSGRVCRSSVEHEMELRSNGNG